MVEVFTIHSALVGVTNPLSKQAERFKLRSSQPLMAPVFMVCFSAWWIIALIIHQLGWNRC